MTRRLGLALLVGALLWSACGGGSATTSGPQGSCVFIARFQGQEYTSVSVRIAPVEGRPLGVAIVPGCNDTGGTGARDEEVPVAEFPGLAPEVAILMRGASDRVLVPSLDNLPAPVRDLLHAPTCDPADEPIELSGKWLGIHNQDQTEVDLIPPYQLDLLVEAASAVRYERAYLTVNVPPSLGTPLTREDVADSLWKGGGISITAVCHDTDYEAQQVAAFPPAG